MLLTGASAMRSTNYGAGNSGRGLRLGLSVLELWIDAHSHAQQHFFTEVRGKFADIPILDGSFRLAETIGRQQSDWAHLLIGRIERAVSARQPADEGAPAFGGAARTGWSNATGEARSSTAPHPPVLRIAIPLGRSNVTVPLTLRNHRLSPDTVSVSARAPDTSHAAVIPPELVRFDPPRLVIEPQSERTVQLHLHIPDLVQPGEYWLEILIEGAETKRIPFALDLMPDTRSVHEP